MVTGCVVQLARHFGRSRKHKAEKNKTSVVVFYGSAMGNEEIDLFFCSIYSETAFSWSVSAKRLVFTLFVIRSASIAMV